MSKKWNLKQIKFVAEGISSTDLDNVTAVHAIVEDDRGKILVAMHRKKGMGLPGGHVENNETPKQAIIRELREEVNLLVDDVKLYCILTTDRFERDTHIVIYSTHLPKLQEPKPDLQEVIDIKWLTRTEYIDSSENKPFPNNVLEQIFRE
jgi:8-oxo-dGTP diphosphatase